SMVRALVAQLKAQVVASEEKERSLRPRVEAQRSASLNLTPDEQKFARLEADSERFARQYETLSNRIEEISVNSRENAGTLGVQVLEGATAGEKPVKPKKALVLAFALLCGCLIGTGMALLSESRDTRLHSPEEVTTYLGMPVLGMVPRMSRRRVAPG